MIKVLLFDFANVLLTTQQSGRVSFELNAELLKFIKQQKSNFTTAILSNTAELLSDQAPYRQEIVAYFDHIFLSKELGLSKDQPAIYMKVAQLLSVEPAQIIFTDDTYRNCEAARQAGCQTIHFQATEQFLTDFSKLAL